MKMYEIENKIFMHPDEWEQWMKKLPNPTDDFQRARNHYLCRNFYESKLVKVFRNAAAFFLIPVLFIVLRLNHFKKQKKNKQASKADAVLFCTNPKFRTYFEDVPDEIVEKYPNRVIYQSRGKKDILYSYCLNKEDGAFFRKAIMRYPFAFDMNLRVLSHISKIRYLLEEYHPKAFVSIQTERDFTTSLLAMYCENKGVEYIGFMHGECFKDLSHAYVRFTKFYVWDKYYIKQFAETGSPVDRFTTYESKRLEKRFVASENPKYYATYYLNGIESKESLDKLKTAFLRIDRGKCSIRPHPKLTDIHQLKELFSDTNIDIEDCSQISLKDSLENAKYIISKYSTVLSEAYYSNLNIVIDDFSDEQLYQNLIKIMYINLNRTTLRLSDLIHDGHSGGTVGVEA